MADEIKTLVVKRDDTPKDETVAVTPGSTAPNLVIKTLRPLSVVGIRTARVYLQALVGLLVAGGIGATSVPGGHFGAAFVQAATLAIAPAAITALQNTIELLAKVDEKAPELRG